MLLLLLLLMGCVALLLAARTAAIMQHMPANCGQICVHFQAPSPRRHLIVAQAAVLSTAQARNLMDPVLNADPLHAVTGASLGLSRPSLPAACFGFSV